MSKFTSRLIGIFIICLTGSVFLHFFLYDDLRQSYRLSGPKQGGKINNLTSKTVMILTDTYPVKLPPKNHSKQVNVKDADAVVIDQPMILNGTLIENKVLKFCDFGSIELTENSKAEIILKEKGMTWACKIANDWKLLDIKIIKDKSISRISQG